MSKARYRKSRRKRRLSIRVKIIIFLALFMLSAFGILLFFQGNVNPIIISISEASVKSVTTSAINDAVYSSISGVNYDELVALEKDSDGNILMLSANSMKINEIAREASIKAEENLALIDEKIVSIPIGTFTGSPLLSGHGFPIDIKIIPVGSVTSKFVSEFEEAGINQIRHKIYLEISASMSIILPVTDNTVLTKTQVLICESLLIGAVPDVYINFGSSGGLLDLVP